MDEKPNYKIFFLSSLSLKVPRASSVLKQAKRQTEKVCAKHKQTTILG